MPADSGAHGSRRPGIVISPRMMAAFLIILFVALFIVLNRDQTRVSFIFFSADVPLWVALAVAACAGSAAGFLIGRRRYKP